MLLRHFYAPNWIDIKGIYLYFGIACVSHYLEYFEIVIKSLILSIFLKSLLEFY